MTNHTEGPWIVDGNAIRDLSPFNECIALVQSKNQNGNARLIAAAPELLQAVKDALLLARLHDLEGAAIDNYRHVIAKAEVK